MLLAIPLTRSAFPADIVKMVESEPELAARIRRVRGGYLKIQGTWMPYEVRSAVTLDQKLVAHLEQVALRLSRRCTPHYLERVSKTED